MQHFHNMTSWFAKTEKEQEKTKDNSKDSKAVAITVPANKLLTSVMSAARKGSKAKAKGSKGQSFTGGPMKLPMKTVPFQVSTTLTLTAAANTAYNTVSPLTPMNGWENASEATGLFDQVRCVSLDVWFSAFSTVAAPTLSTLAAAAFSNNNDALGGVAQSTVVQHSSGPVVIRSNDTQNFTPAGVLHMKVPMQRTTLIPSTATTGGIGGDWFSSIDSSAIIGWILPYIEAGGGSSVCGLRFIFRANMLGKWRT